MDLAELSTQSGWLSEVDIRLAAYEDLPGLEWEGTYIHFRRVYARAFERAQQGEALLWVAEGAGRLLGQLFVLLKSEFDLAVADGRHHAFLHSFRVRPELRRGGLGNRLLADAESDLFQRGFGRVFLHVARENTEAIRFYRRHGYRSLIPISGDWSYEDHLGQIRSVHEPGWRMVKKLEDLGSALA
jgi:ribosomal protein S18 acetylase RimI-like enzyme